MGDLRMAHAPACPRAKVVRSSVPSSIQQLLGERGCFNKLAGQDAVGGKLRHEGCLPLHFGGKPSQPDFPRLQESLPVIKDLLSSPPGRAALLHHGALNGLHSKFRFKEVSGWS